jgi:[acyl-carrier-protein] S-malonyltransferase
MTFRRDPISDHLKGLHDLPADPSLALLFPGQGSQKVGMGWEVCQTSAPSRAIFDTADQVLETGLSRLSFDGPDDELTRTINAQPAILTTSLAYLAAALESGALEKRPAYLAGHSLGEYTALVAAGSLTFTNALRLVRERGRLMEGAGARDTGTMAAIVGLAYDSVIEICRVSGAEACNFNASTQVVVGGTRDAVERACALAKEQGGRGLPMNVAGAFHTSLMEPATAEFHEILNGESIEDPVLPVIGNVGATSMMSAAECRSDLQRQMSSPVLWHQSILHMRDAGVRTFAEVGPGRALTTMLKRDTPELELVSLDGAATMATTTNV